METARTYVCATRTAELNKLRTGPVSLKFNFVRNRHLKCYFVEKMMKAPVTTDRRPIAWLSGCWHCLLLRFLKLPSNLTC